MTQAVFRQVDVFADEAFMGNPLPVVVDADGLSTEQMAAVARWTDLSETTFLLEPTTPKADYRLRIFGPAGEMPFAGYPTLGSCHVWLEAGGKPHAEHIVQECDAGLIRVHRDSGRLAFAAPPLLRSGDVESQLVERIAAGLGVDIASVQGCQWADNGPGWICVLLGSRQQVLSLEPDFRALSGLKLGVAAPWDPEADGSEAHFEVRTFVPDRAEEDPATGSLNAGLAQWLIGARLAPDRYVVAQGTRLARKGRLYVERIGEDIWVGGSVTTRIAGTIRI